MAPQLCHLFILSEGRRKTGGRGEEEREQGWKERAYKRGSLPLFVEACN